MSATSHRLIRAAAGAPLGRDCSRHRPVGRIGGIAGRQNSRGIALLKRSLGDGGQVLSESEESPDHVVDWDACWMNDIPIAHRDQWRDLLTAGHLAAVEGAFVVAWRAPDRSFWLARDAVGERTLFYAPV